MSQIMSQGKPSSRSFLHPARSCKNCKILQEKGLTQILRILQDLCKKCLSCKACKNYIKTHDRESRGQAIHNEQVSYLHVAPL